MAGWADWGQTVTVRHLDHHTSGILSTVTLSLLNGEHLYEAANNESFGRQAAALGVLNHDPGAEISYTNLGYLYLAEIVEQVSGKPLPAWLDDNVFKPLEMTRTHLHHGPSHVVEGLAQSYYKQNGAWRLGLSSEHAVGDSNVVTNPHDLSLWMDYLMRLKTEEPEFWRQLTTPGRLNDGTLAGLTGEGPYSAGLFETDIDGVKLLSHDGWTHAFNSNVVFAPAYGVAVAIITNSDDNGADGKAFDVMRAVLADQGLISEDPKEDAEPGQPQPTLNVSKVAAAMGDFTVSRAQVHSALGRAKAAKMPSELVLQLRLNPETGVVEGRPDGLFWGSLQTVDKTSVQWGPFEIDLSGAEPVAEGPNGTLKFSRGE